MTKLYEEVKNLNVEHASRLLVNISHDDLVREYKNLSDFMSNNATDDVKDMAKSIAKEIARELFQAKPDKEATTAKIKEPGNAKRQTATK